MNLKDSLAMKIKAEIKNVYGLLSPVRSDFFPTNFLSKAPSLYHIHSDH